MEQSDNKKLLEEAKKTLKSLVLVEDKEFILALLSGKIETQEHKEKQKDILDLISRIENNKSE